MLVSKKRCSKKEKLSILSANSFTVGVLKGAI
jgi:hypothetical protein